MIRALLIFSLRNELEEDSEQRAADLIEGPTSKAEEPVVDRVVLPADGPRSLDDLGDAVSSGREDPS